MDLSKNNSINCSNGLDEHQLVLLVSSDLKKIKCNKELLEKRSEFFKKIFECVNHETHEKIVILYLDYNSNELENAIHFLENGKVLSIDSSTDIDVLIKMNHKLIIDEFDEYLKEMKAVLELNTTDESKSCSEESETNDDDDGKETEEYYFECLDLGKEENHVDEEPQDKIITKDIDINSSLAHRIQHVLSNYRNENNWKDFRSTKDILSAEERRTLLKVQRDIVDLGRDPKSKISTMKVTFEEQEFRSEATNKRKATDDIILQVFRDVSASQKTCEVSCPNPVSNDHKCQSNFDVNFFKGLPVVINNAPKNVFHQYNFFERTQIALSTVKTFDNIVFEQHQSLMTPPLFTPVEFDQIIFCIKYAVPTAIPNALYPCFRLSIWVDKIEFFGNGKTISEARDNLVLGVVEYLTKKQMAQQRLCPGIPKGHNMGFSWQEKVRDVFQSILAKGVSIDAIPLPEMYQHLGIRFSFYADDPGIDQDPLITKVRDLTARYGLFKLFNKALDIDFPDPNDPNSM